MPYHSKPREPNPKTWASVESGSVQASSIMGFASQVTRVRCWESGIYRMWMLVGFSASTISIDLHESFKGHVKRWMLRATTSGVPWSTGLSCFPYMWMSVPWPLLVRTARLKVRGCELLKYQRRAYPATIPRPPNPKPSTQNPIEVFLAPNFPIVQVL